MNFKIGQRYVSQSEPALGLGIVTEVKTVLLRFLSPL